MLPARASLPRRLLRLFTAGDPVVALLAAALVFYYCVQPGIFQGKASGDGLFGFFYLPSLILHHTPDMGPAAGDWWVRVLGHESTGHVSNPCPIGTVPFWVPTYLVALALEVPARALWHLDAAKLAPFEYWMAGVGSLAAGLAGIALLFRLLARKLGVGAARFGVVGAALATPLAWYLVTQPLYQHACAFFVVTLLVERWDAWRARMTTARWLALGVIGGAAMLNRIQESVWLLLPGLDALAGMARAARARRLGDAARIAAGAAAMVAVALLLFVPQALLWQWYFGALRTPQPAHHMRWLDPGLVATLWSTRAGLLTWSPALYLVVPGLVLGRRRLDDGLAWRVGLMLFVELWVNASAWDHWGSFAYGARRFTDATPAFALGLAALWAWAADPARRRPAGRVAAIEAALGVGVALATAWLVGYVVAPWWQRAALRLALASVVVVPLALAGTRRQLASWSRAERWLAVAMAFFVGWNLLWMEFVRQRRTKSSGANSFHASTWTTWAQGPAWLGRALDAVGYPFDQPAGWLFALAYHVPPRAYDGIAGSYLLERDCRVHEFITLSGFDFSEDPVWVVEGLPPPVPGRRPGTPVRVAGPRLRMLLPLAGKEPIKVRLTGDFRGRERELRVTWNGTPLPTTAARGELRFEAPEAIVHTRIRANDLVVTGFPPASTVTHLELESHTRWWER